MVSRRNNSGTGYIIRERIAGVLAGLESYQEQDGKVQGTVQPSGDQEECIYIDAVAIAKIPEVTNRRTRPVSDNGAGGAWGSYHWKTTVKKQATEKVKTRPLAT